MHPIRLSVQCAKNVQFRLIFSVAEQQTKKKQNKTASNTAAQGSAGTLNGTQHESSIKPAVITKNTNSNGTKSQNRKKMANGGTNNGGGVEVSSTTNVNGNNKTGRLSAKPAKKVNKTSEMLETISSNTVNTKLDEVLKTVRTLDNTCDFGRCRTKTSLIGQDCTLCQQRFCMKHQLPEVHGCANAIKKEQRTEFLKPRPTLPISAALRRNEQKDAHARLEQKLKEMSLARQKVRK